MHRALLLPLLCGSTNALFVTRREAFAKAMGGTAAAAAFPAFPALAYELGDAVDSVGVGAERNNIDFVAGRRGSH